MQLIGACLQVGKLFLEFLEPLARRRVGFLLQRFAFNLELHNSAKDFVQLGRHRVDLGPELGRRFVHEVDCFVGQESIRDVPVRQHRRGHESGVLDAYAVMNLVTLLQAAKDRYRVFDRRLIHHHRLKAPFERGVFLDVLAILVEGGCTDAVEFTAGEHWFEKVRRVH